ncbi:hypothetical protein D3C77_632200 [compost metagenome]
MPKQPGVGISVRNLPACRSTTVTEVAGVAFCTKAKRSSPDSASTALEGATCAIFSGMITSRLSVSVSTSNSCSTASVGP